jgi:HK97 family phage prohead protease
MRVVRVHHARTARFRSQTIRDERRAMNTATRRALMPVAAEHGGRHRRAAPFRPTVRNSGAEPGAYTIQGHAAVFDKPCDFGVFTEYIAAGALAPALAIDPLEVVSNWQHDDRWILGHTLNGTCLLTEDADGLAQWTRVAPTSYAADLRILIERGDIQQASFCFTITDETWEYIEGDDGAEQVNVTINQIGILHDVTVCALGAYPQTDVSIINEASRDRFRNAISDGCVSGLTMRDAERRGLVPRSRRVSSAPRSQAPLSRAYLAQAKADVKRARAGVEQTQRTAQWVRDRRRAGLPANAGNAPSLMPHV